MDKKLFTPGPTNVPVEIRELLANDMIHHRLGDFKKIFESLSDKLKQIFKTKEEVLTVTSSGTGVMEMSIVNLFSKGDKVAVINVGNFGKRFVEIATVYGLKVIDLKYGWGETYNLDDIKKVISENPDLKGIFMQYSETSTGVLNNVKAIGDLTKDTDIILTVDVISALVVNPFEFDLWNVDCAVAGSQKGFLLPPGLAFIALSQKAIKALDHSDLPKFYFDLKKYLASHKKGQNPYTPAIGLIVAAEKACQDLLDEGLDKVQSHNRELKSYLENELTALGFDLFVKDEDARGATLVSVIGNENLNVPMIRKELENKYGFSVAGGQADYANVLMRVGCLGKLTIKDMEELVNAIKEIIK